MIKNLHFKTLFLLCALIAGSNAWGQTSYTIGFNSTTTNNDGTTAISDLDEIVASGSDYISSILNSDKVYKGKSGYGVKLGSSSAVGKFTMLRILLAALPS